MSSAKVDIGKDFWKKPYFSNDMTPLTEARHLVRLPHGTNGGEEARRPTAVACFYTGTTAAKGLAALPPIGVLVT